MKKATTLILASFVFPIFYSHAEPPDPESPLARMVTHSFETGNSSAFVSFRRQFRFADTEEELSTPKPQRSVTYVDHPRILQITPGEQYDYYAFLVAGSEFLVATSTQVILSSNAIVDAGRLRGFDSDDYWELTLNAPYTRFLPRSSSHQEEEQEERVAESKDFLRIFPLSEVTPEVEEDETHTIASFNRIFKECLSVVQLGRPETFDRAPEIRNGEIEWKSQDGVIIRGIVEGGAKHPTLIKYPGDAAGEIGSVVVEFDYASNTVLVTERIAAGRFLRKTYEILSYENIAPDNQDGLFSWRTYRNEVGELIASTTQDGKRWLVDVTEDMDLAPVQPIQTAQIQVETTQIFNLWLLIFLLLAGGLPLVFLAAKKRNRIN